MSSEAGTIDQTRVGSLGANAVHSSRNRRLGLLGGVFSGLAHNLLQPEIIVAGLVYELTRSPMLAALVAVINKLGSLAPPLLVGSLVEHRPLRRPYFALIYAFRAIGQIVLIGTMLLMARTEASAWSLAAFFGVYLLIRIAFRVNYIGLALMIPYGTERLAAGPDAPTIAILGGILTAAGMASLMVSSPLWGWIADRFGSRATLLAAGICELAAPLLALAAPRLPAAFSVRLPGVPWRLDLRLIVFILSLAAFRAGLRGDMIGGQRFLITNAPGHRRASYLTFLNAITSPLALLPLAAAWLGGAVGMDWAFGLIACAGVLSLIGAARMSPER